MMTWFSDAYTRNSAQFHRALSLWELRRIRKFQRNQRVADSWTFSCIVPLMLNAGEVGWWGGGGGGVVVVVVVVGGEGGGVGAGVGQWE